MFERRLYFHIDWLLIVAALALCGIGVAMIYSTTHAANSRLYVTQLYAIGLGLIAMAICLTIDYRSLAESSHWLYIVVIVLLLYVAFFGAVRGGARRWIPLGFFNLQPSEFAKIAVALVLAKFFDETLRGQPTGSDLAIAGGLTVLPMAFIAKEPDLGTAVTLVPVFLAIGYLAGMRFRFLGILLLAAVVMAPVAWRYGLRDYQKNRIVTFLDPDLDPRGGGYQQIQARITVGSGGILGKGFGKGTQGQLRFLPVAHTDFVFSALAEEMGLLGVVTSLALYLFVILRCLQTARLSRDRLGAFLVLGVLAGFSFQVIYNVTMSAGLAPVKGLTLPLLSYGGSSAVATLAGFGLILNVRMRRFTN
jgi:rod shape determining protein RodA